MPERPRSTPTPTPSASTATEEHPQLRLAGTPAGEPTAHEREVLALRQEMVFALGSLQRDARMIFDRLERAGRVDPIREVTGSGALEVAAENAEELIRTVDELLLEVTESATSK
ncbi:MAG: hypothetical protein MK085_12810 [Phycisphaerales bacterium]|nr:hypothetical protein [Phycisphaerales bacterium]